MFVCDDYYKVTVTYNSNGNLNKINVYNGDSLDEAMDGIRHLIDGDRDNLIKEFSLYAKNDLILSGATLIHMALY